MKRNFETISLAFAFLLTLGPLNAASAIASDEEAIREKAKAFLAAKADDSPDRFCSAWRRLKLGMPFAEAEALGIEMNGSCTPGKPQSFHQPYMDLYFDAECRALHGATTIDC
ncbi:MAG: hypothetical protein JRG80_02525 [Deltaproteobacteria bacterium]|nr:hypothetical protein [Deltaproteobacteria bacterium]MBW2398128.1 hypothetical protein [Deltaproteobacteria bacterium]MBW2666611.1 hypothetical protein [Deltaproteobacteria bacterium]